MFDLLDLKEVRSDRSDSPELLSLLKQLLGQPFHFFRVAYGDELRLHMGELRPYSSPKMRGRMKGSYVVAARASMWVVFSAPHASLGIGGVSGAVDTKQIEAEGWIERGSTVSSVSCARATHGFSLQLGFSDGSTVFIGPTADADEHATDDDPEAGEDVEVEVSDWEIVTPHHRILKAGPGPQWCYVDSAEKKRPE